MELEHYHVHERSDSTAVDDIATSQYDAVEDIAASQDGHNEASVQEEIMEEARDEILSQCSVDDDWVRQCDDECVNGVHDTYSLQGMHEQPQQTRSAHVRCISLQ